MKLIWLYIGSERVCECCLTPGLMGMKLIWLYIGSERVCECCLTPGLMGDETNMALYRK